VRLIILNRLSGNPLTRVDQIIGINKSNHLPKCISFLHEDIISEDPIRLRFVLTLLSISRAIPGWKEIDLNPIVES
jgi:hypothetical protein